MNTLLKKAHTALTAYADESPEVNDLLSRIDQALAAPVQQEPVPSVVIRDGLPTLLRECDIKPTDARLYTSPQPAQQEPVADVRAYAYSGTAKNGEFFEAVLRESAKVSDGEKLYKSPPAQHKPLTTTQREAIYQQWRLHNWTPEEVIQAIEAAHGIKDNT